METRAWEVLEFHKVIERLKEHASSPLGREKIESLKPSNRIEEVADWQQATQEGCTVLRLKEDVPLAGIKDIRSPLKRAKIGGILHPQELLDIASTLNAAAKLKRTLLELAETHELPILQRLAGQIHTHRELQQAIKACIDDYGEVLDAASPALRNIRREIRAAEARIKERLDAFTRSPAYQKMLQENIVTIRNDRYVLPVKQEYRQEFGGIVHDQSSSGATLFIEPQALVEINNRLRELKLKEEREIERILAQLSGEVAKVAEELEQSVFILAELDFIFAKAYYARAIRGTPPKLNDRRYLKIKKGRHPLLPPERVVPLDVELGGSFTALIVTGPNTGGKTVSLKTVGLLTLMAMSGLHVPADDGSEFAVFSSVFADIGDEQSIEQSLSTFSGHMRNIISILERMDENSLVLLDELGAGTDPTEGSALAIAILDYILQKGARVMATTHYSELKAYAYNRENVMNASVEFDVHTLSPTYRLLLGVPGRSNAFAIAERLGLRKEIIEVARKQISREENRVEEMIASLEKNRRTAEAERLEAERLRAEAERLKREWEEERERFAAERDRMLQKAREEAEQAVQRAKKEAEQIISELRALAQAERANIKEHRLIEAKKRLEEALPQWPEEKPRRKHSGKKERIVPGDEVYVLSVGQKGHVLEAVGEDEFQVQIGILKMKVHRADLQLIKQEKKKEPVPIAAFKGRKETVKPELDLRGYNVEDAIIEIDKYLDSALLAGLHQVALIHGKGTGALRSGVHEFLKRHKHVKSFRLGGQGEGGLGATIVELK
ncbi:endonuclease MutS2 [Bacillaceae bacterium]